MTISGIVLCGGQSRRMGMDKAALPFGDETLLQRAVRVAGTVAGKVIIVARGDQELIREDFRGVPVRIVHDAVADQGPLAGLAAGLSASATGISIVIACDMPLIRTAVLQRLIDELGEADACVAVVDGRPSPLCAVYRSAVAGAATELLAGGERRVTALLDRVQTKRVDAAVFRDIDPDLDSFASCNTPDAYRQALVRLKADTTSA
ncbi:MAG: molybdenum cofactor guanylyltransferase [Vicinamibacterales bacterium]